MNASDLEGQLQLQIEKINDAISKARQNEIIDMTGMDDDVSEICRKIMSLDNNAVGDLESKMIQMINLLDELAIELKQYQDRVDPHG